MKLRFTIDYRTEWGQQLVVALSYHSQDGSERMARLVMQTEDGERWGAETSVLESRRSPIESFTYYYLVEDADGTELRREWNLVPRTYAFDSSKTFTMADQWRDMPLNSHLYTSAYGVSTSASRKSAARAGQQPGALRPLKLPLFRKTILFRVSAPQLKEGQSLAIVGSHPALGSWNPTRYLPMEPVGVSDWMLTLNVDWLGLPLDYKYVVVDPAKHELLAWEEGDNRSVNEELSDGEVYVTYGAPLRIAESPWRVAGVCVPVFSLRSEQSCGVGDFGDLRRFVEWAAATGMRCIQLLPVNDTTVTGQWSDCFPYNIISVFALHPHYIDLNALGALKDKRRMTAFRRRQGELNALAYSDYEAVESVKTDYLLTFFAEQGGKTLESADFKAWIETNRFWLEHYCAFYEEHQRQRQNKPLPPHFVEFLQYHLHLQLKAAADAARSQGIFLKGDLPIGVSRQSVETQAYPEFFHLDMQAGAPPDVFAMQGQNWGFPTYRWDGEVSVSAKAGEKVAISSLTDWFHRRLEQQEQYFDALRIDHVLGFFRIWEIPSDQLFGTMGHFSPALPLTPGDIEYFGLSFRRDFLTKPFINDTIVDRVFGIHAQYVRDTFLERKAYGLYDLKPEVASQRKIEALFAERGDENSLWIRDGLYRLVANVLFLEDPRQPDMYHPRIQAYKEPVFEALNMEERDAYMRLYNNFFYQRHTLFWGKQGYDRLTALFGTTHMLICAEDLGMMPDCVAPVLDALRILTLEIQQMPKQSGVEFTHLDGNPIRSVATISTHDMAPIRLWWEEQPERAQRFYTTMLQKQGRAPEHLPAHLAEEMIARHLYSPSMLCILSLQDWLAMDSELRSKNPREERINVPSDPFNRWQWRMHLTIEQLLKADRMNGKLKTMITRSKR